MPSDCSLTTPNRLEQLVRYLVGGEPTHARYSNVACELLCSGAEAMVDALMEDEGLINLLFSVLRQPPPLPSTAAMHFGRVLTMLLARRPDDVMCYLAADDLEQLVAHIGITAIAEVVRVLLGVDAKAAHISQRHMQWVSQSRVVPMMLARLLPGSAANGQGSICSLLCAAAKLPHLAVEVVPDAQVLLEHALSCEGNAVAAFEVLLALMQHSALAGAAHVTAACVSKLPMLVRMLQSPADPASVALHVAPGASVESAEALAMPVAVAADQPQVAAVTADNAAVGSGLAQATTAVGAPAAAVAAAAHGGATAAAAALGLVRVKVVALIAALLRAGDAAADEAIVQAEVLPLLLELFVQYPFHNVLHHHVTEAIITCLQRHTPLLSKHLLVKLAHWLVFVPVEIRPGHGHGPAGHTRGAVRAGYMGHVIRIARMLSEIIRCPACVGGRVGLVEEEVERQDVQRWKPASDDPAAQQQQQQQQQQQEEEQQKQEEEQQQQEEEKQEDQQQQQQHPLPQDQHEQAGGGCTGTAHAASGRKRRRPGVQHKQDRQQDSRALQRNVADRDAANEAAFADQDAVEQRALAAQGAPAGQEAAGQEAATDQDAAARQSGRPGMKKRRAKAKAGVSAAPQGKEPLGQRRRGHNKREVVPQ